MNYSILIILSDKFITFFVTNKKIRYFLTKTVVK